MYIVTGLHPDATEIQPQYEHGDVHISMTIMTSKSGFEALTPV